MEEEKTEKSQSDDVRAGGVIPGVILIILGILFLLPRLGVDFGKLWPTFILAPGLAFWAFYLVSGRKEKNAGILIPGTITTLIAVFFYYLSATSWEKLSTLWPLFPLIVGISFYVFYLASGRKEKGILVPANILSLIGVLFLALNSISYNLWPLILIIVGVFFLVPRKR
ncbi:MAG TPA: hypothetical protein PK263_01155 [bacterium]|nr:hypothetical protein [bacterium]